MNIQHYFLNSLKYLFLTMAIFISIVLIINLSIFDEDVKPEVSKILEAVEPPTEGNAYYAFMGISSESDKDMISTGKALVIKSSKKGLEKESSVLKAEDDKEFLGDISPDENWETVYGFCRSRDQLNCISEIIATIKQNPVKDERLNIMLGRYKKIQKMQNYKVTTDSSFALPIPSYGNIVKLSKINMGVAYLSDNNLFFIREIAKDMKFWRMILNDENTLIDKMISVAVIWTDLQYLSEFVNKREISDIEKKEINTLLKAFTRDELNIIEAFEFELRYTRGVFNEMKDEKVETGEWWDRVVLLIVQYDATINSVYENLVGSAGCLSKLESAELAMVINDKRNKRLTSEAKTVKCFSNEKIGLKISPSSLYNPGGKILASIGIPEYEDYIARVHDLNGMISLVKLQLELKLVNQDAMEQVIINSTIKNHYTDKPMDYDKDKGILSFECLDNSSKCWLKL